jgi:hypothetical protein
VFWWFAGCGHACVASVHVFNCLCYAAVWHLTFARPDVLPRHPFTLPTPYQLVAGVVGARCVSTLLPRSFWYSFTPFKCCVINTGSCKVFAGACRHDFSPRNPVWWFRVSIHARVCHRVHCCTCWCGCNGIRTTLCGLCCAAAPVNFMWSLPGVVLGVHGTVALSLWLSPS